MPRDFLTLYPPLNLRPAPLRIKQQDDGSGRPAVFDPLRRRWVALTPEEWVRQHFVAMLIAEKGYPASRVANETSITLNGTSRRCDTVVFDSHCCPLIIVEFKAPSVTVSQKTFDQIVRYNMVLKARYLVVSNGLHHFCAEISYSDMSYKFLEDIPSYSVS